MKRILSLFAGAVLCATAIAQHGPMAFVGLLSHQRQENLFQQVNTRLWN